MSKYAADKVKDTYDLGIQPSGVCALNHGMIEIVWIAFIMVL